MLLFSLTIVISCCLMPSTLSLLSLPYLTSLNRTLPHLILPDLTLPYLTSTFLTSIQMPCILVSIDIYFIAMH